MAVNRLVEPMPEWPMVRWWRRTALPQLLGIPTDRINDDRLYRCLDVALLYKEAVEERIAGVGRSWFGQSYRYLLYDLTSTYFEGQMEANLKAPARLLAGPSSGLQAALDWCGGGPGRLPGWL